MHQIYSNAYCTIALIPDFYVDPQNTSQLGQPVQAPNTLYTWIAQFEWFSRVWTLEKAIMSSRIIFVGRNIHTWWYAARNFPPLAPLCLPSQQ
ncbi:hypothetical protein BDB00DRAFT_811188 [Zychaea mexicana]|uniref:uncharacterized protein n=1 Tax=Zychaea mexicana TaxID=64656 RepID=UPI0022FDB6C0|nr:uncharacterized protein BDB00DRAFT_811188 [Zychaea mexicana]KAI9495973.1 hypothetical protein BDB00DRAFT_811188 [Zychaea mexicana]